MVGHLSSHIHCEKNQERLQSTSGTSVDGPQRSALLCLLADDRHYATIFQDESVLRKSYWPTNLGAEFNTPYFIHTNADSFVNLIICSLAWTLTSILPA